MERYPTRQSGWRRDPTVRPFTYSKTSGTLAWINTSTTAGPDTLAETAINVPGANIMTYDPNLLRLYIPGSQEVAIVDISQSPPSDRNDFHPIVYVAQSSVGARDCDCRRGPTRRKPCLRILLCSATQPIECHLYLRGWNEWQLRLHLDGRSRSDPRCDRHRHRHCNRADSTERSLLGRL